ncbi:hypothetical protein [Tsukamurella strandjordii]|uniref:Uncharacterized protein n=1 Tax=Tsukamurella strandjordii TaxID=147577 RepID=A0AA90NAU7_9ACTN|nr:hypothetical protein [Tsukamurella strandjordii]MDP0399137.1 hypothetical protein [Tsukamurella strandjordii]
MQPQLADKPFEVHQLSSIVRVWAEAVDTRSGVTVAPAQPIGEMRTQLAQAVGVEYAYAR